MIDERLTVHGTPRAFVGSAVINQDHVSKLEVIYESLIFLSTSVDDPGLNSLLSLIDREVAEIREGAIDLTDFIAENGEIITEVWGHGSPTMKDTRG